MQSVKHATIVLYPTASMSPAWIVMSPMDDTSFRVPLVFPSERNTVAFPKRRNPRRKIDVMRYQNRLTGRQTDDKALMTTALIVIREYFYDGSFRLDLDIAGLIRERRSQCAVDLDRRGSRDIRQRNDIVPVREEGDSCRDDDCEREFSHARIRPKNHRAVCGASYRAAASFFAAWMSDCVPDCAAPATTSSGGMDVHRFALVDDLTHAGFDAASQAFDEFRVVGLPAFKLADNLQRIFASV